MVYNGDLRGISRGKGRIDGEQSREMEWTWRNEDGEIGKGEIIYERKEEILKEKDGMREMWRCSSLSGLMSRMEWKERWQWGYGERERGMGRGDGEQERDLCAFPLVSMVCWDPGRKSETWSCFSFLPISFFSFCSYIGFCFSLWFLQTNCSPFLPLCLFLISSSLCSPLFEIILTCPFTLNGKGAT